MTFKSSRPDIKRFFVPTLLFLSILGSTETKVPSLLFYGGVGVVLTFTLIYYLYASDKPVVRSDRFTFGLFMAIISVYVTTSFLASISGEFNPDFVLLAGISYGSFVIIFIVPKVTEFTEMLHWVSIISAILGGLGILALIVGEYDLLVATVSIEHGGHVSLLNTDIRTPPIKSILSNQNGLAHITGVGVFSSALLIVYRRDVKYGLFLTISLVALLLTGSRSSIIILGAGTASLLALYAEKKRSINISSLVIYSSFIVTCIYIFLFFVYSPSVLYKLPVNLAGRVDLWEATTYVTKLNIMTGTGYATESITEIAHANDAIVLEGMLPERLQEQSPHNSYLSIFLHTGIVGGAVYVLFIHYSFYRASIGETNFVKSTVICIGTIYIALQNIEEFGILGFNIHSVIFALALGYGVQYQALKKSDDDTNGSLTTDFKSKRKE